MEIQIRQRIIYLVFTSINITVLSGIYKHLKEMHLFIYLGFQM